MKGWFGGLAAGSWWEMMSLLLSTTRAVMGCGVSTLVGWVHSGNMKRKVYVLSLLVGLGFYTFDLVEQFL
ncbi:hypothetical protein QBC38DRAFT_477104 [Podospora fimiseda]|uniref:Uncharacterized protein n=1 Tax=Podospora fimiseda TaxID=252190 RepID=A0AAN7BQJ6_9PEZI|nr:hypothetical protein QBC38DRAFT_477104 [Podospora fimiseda]